MERNLIRTLQPELNLLINQLHINCKIFDQLSEQATEMLLKRHIDRLNAQRQLYAREIGKALGINMEEYQQVHVSSITMAYNLCLPKLHNILLNHEEEKMLSLLVEVEEKLSRLYYTAIQQAGLTDFINMILKKHMNEMRRDMQETTSLQSVIA